MIVFNVMLYVKYRTYQHVHMFGLELLLNPNTCNTMYVHMFNVFPQIVHFVQFLPIPVTLFWVYDSLPLGGRR